MNNSPSTFKAYAAIFTVYIVWGTTLGAMRIGVETIPTALLPCLRFTIAGLILLAFCLLRGEKIPNRQEIRTHFIVGALLFSFSNALAAWTVQHMSTGLSGLLVATTPFWMLWLSSRIPPRERIAPQAILGIAIGFLGMFILLLPQLSNIGNTSLLFWASVIVSIVTTFFWSVGSIYARKHPTPTSSLLMSIGLQNLFAGLLLVPFCLLTVDNWQAIHPSAASLMALGHLIVLGTIAATSCYLYTLKNMPISVTSTFAYVTPVITVLFGWLFLHEPLTSPTIIGSAVILSGVMVVQWFGQNRPLPHPKAEPLREEIPACGEPALALREASCR
jgi:drug/metabolite transporter (DMT)-like permease